MNRDEFKIYVGNCQKQLHMLGELYNRGYKSIRPIPDIREGTGRWRLFFHTDNNYMISVHQWFSELGEPDISWYDYEKTACTLSVNQLADQFIKDHSIWLQESKLNAHDEIFSNWYQSYLTTLKEGDSPFAETMTIDSIWLIANTEKRRSEEECLKVIPGDFSSLRLPISKINS
ncbi:hypothetical protein GKR75_07880 [Providencia sp. wls1919]|nr:hypothetical protein [Providencia sp. wls1919]